MEDWLDEMDIVFADGNEYHVKPLTKAELDKKMAQGDFEGNIYKQVFELIEANYEEIKAAKPQVSKNSAGYYLWNVWDRETGIFNLCKLLVGSQGTLGIITKSKFKLMKPKTHARMLVMFLKDLSLVGHLVNDILKFKPETFESYDDHTLKLAVRFMPEMAKAMGGAGVIKMGISFIPEALTVMRLGGLPKLVLMAEFVGDSEKEVEDTIDKVYEAVSHYRYQMLKTASKDGGKKYWTVRRESFNLLRKHVKGVHTAPFIDDMVINPEDFPTFIPELNEIMGQYDLNYTVAGHIGNGNFHIIPLMDLSDPKTKEIIPKLSREAYALVLKYKGSITGEHNDGLVRTPFILDMFGHDIYNLFIKTKKIFDPLEILNPGKKVHGNLSYAMHHFVDDKHIQSDDKKGRWNITTKPADS
jgi:FAD/FMN-containing dehydrogenase